MKERMKKLLALTMCATLVLAPATVLAGENGEQQTPSNQATGDAPIYSYDVERVVVPTSLKVALNPDKMTVTTDKGELPDDTSDDKTTTDQIVSLNYGVLNLSTDRTLVTMEFTVTDNTGVITFVDSEEEVTAAEDDEYAVWLNVVPASTVDITPYDTQDGTGAEGTDGKILNAEIAGGVTTKLEEIDAITPELLADIKMTESEEANEIVTLVGNGELGLVLEKAKYTDAAIELGTTTEATGTISELEAGCFGGFTFSGAMNEDADWASVAALEQNNNISISVVYGWEDADKEAEVGVAELEKFAFDVTYDKSDANAVSVNLDITPTSVKLVEKPTPAAGTVCDIALTAEHYSLSGTTLTLNNSWLKNNVNGDWKIVVTDGTTTKTITLTVQD